MVGVSCYLAADQATAHNVFQCECFADAQVSLCHLGGIIWFALRINHFVM